MNNGVVFNNTSYQLSNLIGMVDAGTIALPDIQRPFVWKKTKVRDLMDSLYKGLPAGLVIFWKIAQAGEFKPIGMEKSTTPNLLVIDGQQRLTSLYAVIKGKAVLDKNFNTTEIKISFNPLEEKFEVMNPAIERDPEWISNIGEIFADNPFEAADKYFENMKTKKPEKDIDEKRVKDIIARVWTIQNYPFSALELSSELDPEEVAEIFVRINSKGESLNQSDFILTLMSVYWDEGRKQLESFSRESEVPSADKPSPYNIINMKPRPEDLLRTIIGFAFLRGRLKYGYLILKGRDLENQTTSEEERNKNFEIFKEGQEKALDLTNWHDFIKIVNSSGLVNDNMIRSKSTFYATYALYLIGKYQYTIHYKNLESIIRRWLVFCILTGRYTSSPETKIEKDLVLFREDRDFEITLNKIMSSELTNDFWSTTLPERLVSSSTTNNAYKLNLAAMVFADKNVLFSNIKLREYLNPQMKFKKNALDVHHIFPKNYLKENGIKEIRDHNQVANFIYIQYKENIQISDKHPSEYWLLMLNQLSENEKKNIEDNYTEYYSLPEKFWEMDYFEFLEKRRVLMANSIKNYFESL